jgi:hypothetical protein
MSQKIVVQSEIRNMNIIKNTLTKMGIEFTEQDQSISIMKLGYPISINTKTGQISYDSDQEQKIGSIKQQYMVNMFREKAILEGMKVHQETNANGDIEIYLSN